VMAGKLNWWPVGFRHRGRVARATPKFLYHPGRWHVPRDRV